MPPHSLSRHRVRAACALAADHIELSPVQLHDDDIMLLNQQRLGDVEVGEVAALQDLELLVQGLLL
eukprot:16203740-Heterocapsa_arctica.AAC.1